MTPLDVFKVRWEAAPMPLPFFETVNSPMTIDELPEQWGTALLDSTTREDMTFGSNPWVNEDGNVVVALFCKSGVGRSTLDPAVDALRAFFHGYQSPDLKLHFVQVVGPAGDEPEGNGDWYRLTFLVPYRFRSRRLEPPMPLLLELPRLPWTHP